MTTIQAPCKWGPLLALAAVLAGLAPVSTAQPEPGAFALRQELTAQAIFSCGDLKISGNSVVTSEGVGAGAGEEGHVRSNADVTLNGAVEVHGDAIAGPGGQVILNGAPATVTGEIRNAEEALDCRPIDLGALAAALAAANDNGSLPKTDKGKTALGGPDGRAFDVKGNDGITFPPGTYFFSSLKLTGNSAIRVNGPVRILVTGAVDVQGRVNAGGDPFRFRLWSAGDVKLASKALVHGFVYAPDGAVSFVGQSVLKGAVWAGTVDVAGGSRVIRAVDDVAPTIDVATPAEGDVVEVCEIPVRGTVADGETAVALTVNGEPVELDPDGAFDVEVSLYTADPGLIELVATDLSGNTTTVRVRVEIVLPVVALVSPAPGSLVGRRVVTLSGTSGTAVEVTVDGRPAEVSGGAFTLADFDLGADGLKTLEIAGTNCGGTGTATVTLDLDTTPPSVAIDGPVEGDLFGASPITVTGEVEDAHLAGVTVNGVAAAVTGTRFVAEGVTLTEGDNILVAVAADQLGLATSSAPVTVELDTTAPTVTIDVPAAGAIVDTPSITVEGEVSDPNLTAVTVNGVPATVTDMRFSAPAVPLAEGPNALVATAVDRAGNRADSPSVTVVLDTLPPEVAIDADALVRLTADAEITVAGTVSDPHLDGVTVNGVTAAVSGGTWAADVPLVEGANQVTAAAVDTLGHRAETPPEEVVRDSTPPEIEITEPAPGAELGSRTVVVRGTVSDAHLDTVTVEGVPASVTGGTFEATVELPEGESEIDARAVDLLGQATDAAPVPVTVDTLPPVVEIDPPAEPLVGTETVTVTGTFVEPHLDRITVSDLEAVISGNTFTVADVPLAEGPNPLVATATDTFGHQADSAPITWTRDTTPPSVAIDSPADGAVLDTPEIAVSGTVDDLHLAAVSVNGAEATVEDGRFTAAVALAEGPNLLVATAVDQVDNSADSAPVTVVLDTLAPEVAIDPGSVPALTDLTAVSVSGTVSDAHLDAVNVNGVAAVTTGGAFTAADVPLAAEGDNALVAEAVDTLGHRAESAPVVVVRDTLAPELAITAPPAGAQLDSRTVTVTGTVSDAHLDAVTVNGVAAAVAGGAWEATIELPEGDSTIAARATDVLGHATDAGPVPVTVDTLAPVVTLAEPAAALVDTATVTVTGTIEEPHLQALTVNGVTAAVAGSSFSAAVPLSEGANDIVASATDTFGHAAVSNKIVVVLDTLAPEIAIDAPVDGTVVTSLAVTVEGPVSDAHLESVAVNGTAALVAGGRFSVTVPVADGANNLTAVAVDELGHSAEATVVVFLDTLPPAVTLDQPALGADECVAAGTPVTLGGRFSDPNPATGQNGQPDAVVVEVRATGGVAPATYVGTLSPDGRSWSAAGVALGAADGIAAATVTATDVIGNAARVSRTWRVDAGTPVLTLTLDGVPFPGAAAGATPPAGAEPTLFARRIAAGASVTDGASFAPPDAVLTLDGNPYAAGTPITAEGDHLLVATVTDCAGHTAKAHAFFRLDLTAPALTATNPADGAVLAQGIASYRGTSDSVLAEARVDGKPAAVQGNAFTLAPYPWREGENRVTIELADPAGNSSVHRRTFTVRSLGLTVEIVESGLPIAAGQVFLRPVKPIVRASDPEADLVATLDGQPFTSGGEVSVNGQHTLSATAGDALGRTATASATFTVDVAGGPKVEITSPGDGTTVAGTAVTVSGTVDGDQPSVAVNGVAAVVTGGAWTAAGVPLEPDVLNDLLAEAVDRRGRRDAHQVSVLALSSGPTVLILEPADGAVTNRRRIDVAGAVVGGAVRTADGTVTVAGTPGIPVATDGTFRALDVPLAEGVNVLTAESLDPQGLLSQASVTVLADFTPPSIAISAGGRPLDDGVTFSRAVTLVVEVTDAGGEVAETAVRLNGSLQSQTERSEILIEADGGYVVSVVARDRAGNESRVERAFLLDLGGCALSAVEPPAGASVAASQVTLRGLAGTARAVRVRVPDTAGGFQVFDANLADATFLAGDVPLPDVGENALQIVCVDAAGESHVVDHPLERLAPSSGPTIRITAPVAGDLVDAEAIEVSGTTSGGTSSAGTVTVNGVAAAVAGGTFTATGVPLVEGPNVLGARVVDAAGKAASDRVVIGRDSAAPKVRITAPDDNQRIGVAGAGPAAVDVSGLVDVSTEPHLQRVTVESAAGSVVATLEPATGAFLAEDVPLDAAAPAGEPQTLTARARDTLGHESSVSVDVVLDAGGPAIVLFEPADLARYDETSPAQIAVSGEAWAAEGGAITLNGGQLDPADLAWADPDALGRLHTPFSASVEVPAQDGAFGLIAKVSDLEGRYAQTRRLLQKDSTAPEVIEMVPADGTEGVDPNSILLVLFSEPVLASSLAAADGLTLTRLSTSEIVVATSTVAGNAVGLAPGSGLAPGELYRFRAGLEITDADGHPLAAPFEVTFRVAQASTAAAPVLDPLPAVICAEEIFVTGTATPGVQVRVKDATLTFSSFADPTGAFSVRVPVTSNGYHLLHVFTVDSTGVSVSPEATAVLRVDCSAPAVVDAAFDRDTGALSVTFSEEVDPATIAAGAAGDAIRLTDGEDPATLYGGALSFPDGRTVEILLDLAADAWWRDRPVRLVVGPPAADLEGNVMLAAFEVVFFPGGGGLEGGFLFGEAYDDVSGRPLAGAQVGLFTSSAALPGTAASAGVPVDAAVTEGRGRFTMASVVPAGRYAVLYEKEGYTRVVRRLALEPAVGAVPFDARLTPRAAAAGVLDPAAGGRAELGETLFALEAAAGALPGADPLTVRVTPLSGQGLPDFLPFGWTPAVAAELSLEAGGEALAENAGNAFAPAGVWLELPLPEWVLPGDELFAAAYDLAAGVWTSLGAPQPFSGPAGEALVRVAAAGPGAVAVILPDEDPATRPPLPELEDEPLRGSALPSPVPDLEADLTLDPPVVPPTGRSRARVVARSADGSSPWPAGLAVQAFLDEKLILAGNAGQLLEAPFSADLVLYHPRLSSAELSGNAEASAGAVEFNVSPSPRAAQVLLEVGFENIRLFPFPELVERGPVIGPAGGSVGSPADGGVELILPEGALPAPTAVSAELLSQAELDALPLVEGYDTLAAVRVDFGGQILARSATLKLDAPASTPAEIPGDPRLLLAELADRPDSLGGQYPRLAARTEREPAPGGDGERIVATPDLNGILPLEGIVREGVYLVLYAHASVGFATGIVRGPGGVALEAAAVTTAGLGTADFTRAGGRYSLVVPAGADRVVTALHPLLDETGTGEIPALSPGQEVLLDIEVQPVAPAIVSLTPADGAVDQPVGTVVSILFSEKIDPSSVGGSTLRLELAGPGGLGTGAFILGAEGQPEVSQDGFHLSFRPKLPLPPGRRFVATFTGGVRDAGGTYYEGPVPVTWRFESSTVVAPGGQVDPEKFHLRVPVAGVAEVYADAGALPLAQAGQAPWTVSPFVAVTEPGVAADPQRDSIPARTDGSFSATVGHPPQFPVTIEDQVWVTVLDPAGQVAAEFRVGPFTTPDGKGFVASPDEDATFTSAEGNVVEVAAGTFDKATLVTVSNLLPSSLGVVHPEGMKLGAYVDVDFEGTARETLRVHVPAPADAADDAQVFIGRPVDLPWGRRLQFMSYGGVLVRDGERFLSNDPSLQPEPDASLLGGPEAKLLSSLGTKRTCRDVRDRGLSLCFTQTLMLEFTARQSAAFFYEAGVLWTIMLGGSQPFPFYFGLALEALYNRIADTFVYVPDPHDWGGYWVLPVAVDSEIAVVRRDTSTGWILHEQAYDPVQDLGPLIEIGLLGNGEPLAAPMLIDAVPFHVSRFEAPEAFASSQLRIEVEAEADGNRKVVLRAVPDFPLPDHTTVAVWDLTPTDPLPPENAPPEADPPTPAPPIEGPVVHVCEDAKTWESRQFEGTRDMLMIVAPGDLDANGFSAFEFQFDRSLVDVGDRDPGEVAFLEDLGSSEGCSNEGQEGFPQKIPVEVSLRESRSRLIVTPLGTLPAGHRFRLELKPEALRVEDENGGQEIYWDTAPRLFEFATRSVPGEAIGSVTETQFPFGGVKTARDILKFGNLLLVASDNGKILAVNATDHSDLGDFEIHSIKNGVNMVRTLGTDGHNRLYYAALFGSVWAIKTARIEDARAADAECVGEPEWADGVPCFNAVEGSVRIAWALGSLQSSLTGSEWLASSSTLPSGSPTAIEVVTQDEKGETLELEDFFSTYANASLDVLVPDAEGIYTLDIPFKSTYQRALDGEREPSANPLTTPLPAIPEFRAHECAGEEDYDRFQRVTVDNLTTGQSWSFDVENEWPAAADGGGDGTYLLQGLKARLGDQLRVRYNIRALGYVAIVGSGITVVDLNRYYQLLQPFQTVAGSQCGRRLGKYEGQSIRFPSCAGFFGSQPDGIAMTTSVAVHSATGCDSGFCRGEEHIDVYSPLLRVGVVHTKSDVDNPGGIGQLAGLEGQAAQELAACIKEIDGDFAWLRDVKLANEVDWIDLGIRGTGFESQFADPPIGWEPRFLRNRDLLFLSMGLAGVYVFDVSGRHVGPFTLIGHLKVEGHAALLLEVDPVRGLLFTGGVDYSVSPSQSVIDIWEVAGVNVAPGTANEPRPLVSIHAPWKANHLAVDQSGTGLFYTWDNQRGPIAVPFESPKFRFSGLYLPGEGEAEPPVLGERPNAVQKITDRFVPLGVPLETTLEAEEADAEENERAATAAFKVRIALPGSFGEELTAKVQSLRALPEERYLGQQEIGAAVAMPGGPGWPETEVVVTLRRVGVGADETGAPSAVVNGEAGRFGTVYNLYESKETVLLLADPRARRDYVLQDVPDGSLEGSQTADEKAQCRRCEWPSYLPDPAGDDPELQDIVELLAGGRYVRAFLFPSDKSSLETRRKTEEAIAFFDRQGENYRQPSGAARVAAAADAVPSPFQVSLAEPAQNPAAWIPNEAGVSVSLTGGEALLSTSDHRVTGRGIPMSFERTYRSNMLGYGPLGSAGWSFNVFAHVREIETTGEVEYHDGQGHVWRFYPVSAEEVPEGYEKDPAGSYYAAQGVYLRLQKLSGDQGWRLLGRYHDVVRFDAAGRLVEASDRHRRGKRSDQQGNTIVYRYDPFGQLVEIEDDLGRDYRLEYYEDPGPESDGGDGDRYGLLKKVTDFVGRTVEYEYGDNRTLEEVRLPEVRNPVEAYAEFSYEGEDRPTVRYEYDPDQGVSSSDTDIGAVLHGKYAELRLESYFLPDFTGGVSSPPRVRLEYDSRTGRVAVVSFPDRNDQNSAAAGVEWRFDYPGLDPTAAPATELTIRAPWGHGVDYTLESGRTVSTEEELEVTPPAGDPALLDVNRSYTYAEDGRLTSVTQPDGGRKVSCYPDGAGSEVAGGSEGCAEGGDDVDRLILANVTKVIHEATTPGGQGSADYTRISTDMGYQEDNLLSRVSDPLGRSIGMATPLVNSDVDMSFSAEGVRAQYDFDKYGRLAQFQGGGEGGPLMKLSYGKDAEGKAGAGLVRRFDQGAGGSNFWRQLEYDDAYNVKEERTSYGTITRTTFDDWDRAVRAVSGLSDGRFRSVGSEECTLASGAVVETAYDAAGHVIRERRLQDYVDENDAVHCRWVESRYQYNAREQVVAVEQTHLASPEDPGQVIAQPLKTEERIYDTFGRLEVHRSLNLVDPHLDTIYRYDAAGRIAAVRVGEAGEQRKGYDENSRVVLLSDGDEGEWRGRFDVWDRIYHEVFPSGGVVRRQYDEAGNPIRETVWNADPLSVESAEVLSDMLTHFNSFGEIDKRVSALETDPDTGEVVYRVSEQTYDGSGRVTGVFSGPPIPGTDRLDADQARRDVETVYEIESGRVLLVTYGGNFGGPADYGYRYSYDADNKSPWPDRIDNLESVPGETELVETSSTRFERDAFGRRIAEYSSNGSEQHTTYDRTAGAIRTTTGAGTSMSVGFDGRGLPIRHIRPNNRGVTTYAYDLDGRMKSKVATTAGTAGWETSYAYDTSSRVLRIDHEDSTFETFTYNPDSTIATHVTREGVEVGFTYDLANRLLSAIPSAAAALPATLAPLDAGDFYDYDELTRVTRARRGSPGGNAPDPSLTVEFSAFDLASRPVSEIVGSRSPLAWEYDTWNHPVEVLLPAGAGRDPVGGFRGFRRNYDALDRLFDVAGAGGEISGVPLGVALSWGGEARIYGSTTKSPLGTASRFGYIAGRGAQPPSTPEDGLSEWRLGTLTWGAEAGADPVDTATRPPATVWGQLAFGWRGNEGDPRDGAKQGREAVTGTRGGLDLFAGMGWSWNYDAGVRLSYAASGRGDVRGGTPSAPVDSFRYEYGQGDELEKIIRESEGLITELTLGEQGRVTRRGDETFSYDAVGRRTEDDRFSYLWNWRSELVAVTVKPTWPAGPDGEVETSPFAGHQIRYEYDAMGRLIARWHLGKRPENENDDALRPFIEKRVYVWEGKSLLAEAGYGDPEETQLRWRKTYVPGPVGYDDALQVAVDVVDLPGSPFPGSRLYTYLRDELGTVIAIVGEDESQGPGNPAVPVRYFYTPFGESYAETGPELRSVRFDNEVTSVEAGGSTVDQTLADPAAAAPGALRIGFSTPITEASASAGVVVERLTSGGWAAVDPAAFAVGAVAGGSGDLLVLLRDGWERGGSYRVRLVSLVDGAGRAFAGLAGGDDGLEWSVPRPAVDIPEPPVIFERNFAVPYEAFRASGNSLGGRFPGGQNCLFHGLWTDPVTGLAHARARWYDPRNPSWLSEDPYDDADSPNLYAFVGWQPNMKTDPQGEIVNNIIGGIVSVAIGWGMSKVCEAMADDEVAEDKCDYTLSDAAIDFGLGFATSGISGITKLKYVDELGTAAKWAIRVGAEVALDTTAEVVRHEIKGDDYNTEDLVRDAAIGVGIGEAIEFGAKAYRKMRRGGINLSRYADEVAEAGHTASKKIDDVAEESGRICKILRTCFAGPTLVLTADGLVPIEDIRVGDRVITTEDSLRGETAVDERTWKLVRLSMPSQGGLTLELLRSPEWVSLLGAEAGREIWLDLAEVGVSGMGRIESVTDSPPIDDGPGRVVLSTISLQTDRTVELRLRGVEEPLRATADHLVYSVTRNAWLRSAHLLAGEEIWALDGPVVVTSIELRSGPQRVFNAEIEGDHVYLVTDLGILSHNTGLDCDEWTHFLQEAGDDEIVRGMTVRNNVPGGVGGAEHHIATNKNFESGEKWSEKFKRLFEDAGTTLDDPANRVWVPGHQGPHPDAYHEIIFERLKMATEDLESGTQAFKDAFFAQLNKLRTEVSTPGTLLHTLLTP